MCVVGWGQHRWRRGSIGVWSLYYIYRVHIDVEGVYETDGECVLCVQSSTIYTYTNTQTT